jgi:predicted ATP-grasp superfamily ATP-dependent carboligase
VRIHVFEFICGGGLTGVPLPQRMALEADLMLCAVVGDLLALPGVEVSFARDTRLPLPAPERTRGARVCWRRPDIEPAQALAREIGAADAVWPIAPETGGELERAAHAVLEADRVLLGPRPEAIRVAASKSATARQLARSGVEVVPCFAPGSSWPVIDGPWVVKPDDGAGCVDTRIFAGGVAAAQAIGDAPGHLIAQPWIAGDAGSLCVLSAGGATEVASVNRQHVRLDRGRVEVVSIEVNCAAVTPPLETLAARVAAAIPGLDGYFGIDYIEACSGPVVLEVNPRVTSSYAGLGPALELNAAEWALAAAMGRQIPSGRMHRGRTITLNMEAHAAG